MHMGDAIRQLRERAGMSMGQLARRADVDIASISRIEAHKQHLLSQENMARVAQALNVTVEELERQAGSGNGLPPDWPTLQEVLARDRNLTDHQREALLAVYEGFVRR